LGWQWLNHAAARKLGPWARSAPTRAMGIGYPKARGPRSIFLPMRSTSQDDKDFHRPSRPDVDCSGGAGGGQGSVPVDDPEVVPESTTPLTRKPSCTAIGRKEGWNARAGPRTLVAKGRQGLVHDDLRLASRQAILADAVAGLDSPLRLRRRRPEDLGPQPFARPPGHRVWPRVSQSLFHRRSPGRKVHVHPIGVQRPWYPVPLDPRPQHPHRRFRRLFPENPPEAPLGHVVHDVHQARLIASPKPVMES